MHRSAVALFLVSVAFASTAQPARETLLASPEYDTEDLRPKFVTLSAKQVHEGVDVRLVEIDHFEGRAHALEVVLPAGDNVAYVHLQIDSPELRDAKGAVVEWDRSNGSVDRETHRLRIPLLAVGGLEAASFAVVSGRLVVRYPLKVATRTVKATAGKAEGDVIVDGPFVHSRFGPSVVASSPWMSDVDPMRAYDAAGKRLEPDGGAYPDPDREGFELRPFRGLVARVEVDTATDLAAVAIDYRVSLAPGEAAKVVRTPLRSIPLTVLDQTAGLSTKAMSEELALRGYPAIDREQLSLAMTNGDVDAVRVFLAANLDVDGAAGSTPPLLLASTVGQFEVAELLIDAGANVNVQDENGVTPLIRLASNCDATATIKKLLDRGADPNLKGKSPAGPLMLAKAMQCKESVAALERAGAK